MAFLFLWVLSGKTLQITEKKIQQIASSVRQSFEQSMKQFLKTPCLTLRHQRLQQAELCPARPYGVWRADVGTLRMEIRNEQEVIT